jgi:CRP-like cAMP-binding protein
MENSVASAASYTTIRLAPGEVLISQGEPGGSLYVLEEGELAVERDGVEIASINRPYAVVGEMSVVLGTPTSATVRAGRESRVRVFADARSTLSHDADFAFRMAYLMASRLDATSALLVEHRRTHGDRPEPDLVGRLFKALHLPTDTAKPAPAAPDDMFGRSWDMLAE